MSDIVIINILTGMLLIFTGFSSGIFREILGFLFMLFSPGYALVSALYPRKTSFNDIERIGLSLVASIGVVSLTGLILDYTDFGIKLWPILVSISILIFIFSLVVWFRRKNIPFEEKFHFSFIPRLGFIRHYFEKKTKWEISLHLLLVLLLLGAITTVSYIIGNPRVEKFSEFYILGDQGTMDEYTREVIVGDNVTVNVVIVNVEYEMMTYYIQTMFDNQKIDIIGPIVLDHEMKWERQINFLPKLAGSNQKAEILLLKEGESDAYRSLLLWIDVIDDY